VAADNLSRIDISKRIHFEMQTVGRVSKDEQTVKVLVNRQSVTDEDQRWAQKFHEGDVLRYVKSNKTIGVAAREYVRVDAVAAIALDTRKQLSFLPRKNVDTEKDTKTSAGASYN
jgi:hypothetical protein